MGDFDVEVTMTRGTSSDDKERIKAAVEADDVDELDEKMSEVRDRLREWAEDLRSIQPDGRRHHPDQADLGEVNS
jgi:hypothetical protein